MRIAWVLYGSLEQRTGGTIYDAQVVHGLRRAGDEVHVVSLAESGDDLDGAMHARRGFARTLPPIARAVGVAKAGLALAARIREIDPHVVVGDELCFPELGVAFRRLGHGDHGGHGGGGGREKRPRRVLLVHHLTAWELELAPLRRRVVHAAERFAIEASDAVIATSRTTRERLVGEGVRERIDVVRPGADRLSASASASGGGGFLFLGAVVARKRVRELVRAFGRGAGKSATLVVVGSTTRDAAYAESVRGEIARLGLGGRVVVEGEVDEAGVARALARADVLVMPSSLEGYGIAATEAIHAGVPVIAARTHGLEEALAPCPDATLFADDEDALALALDRFASDEGLRTSMRSAARAAAPRMPTWASCAEEFRAALRT